MLSLVTNINGRLPPGVAEQLEKVLSSDAFRNSPRLSEFLRFSVGAALRGESGQIKEYVVGVEVFGRGPDYDPRVDPVVRVEARRLRAKLREYYEEEGREDALRIHFPKGGYVPAFENRAGLSGERQSETRGHLPSRRNLVRAAAGTAAALGAAALFGFVWTRASTPARARIAVLPMRAYGPSDTEDVQRLADGITEAVLSELSRQQDLSVVSWPTAAGYRAAGKSAPDISAELGVGYLAAVGVRRYPDRLLVTVHILDGAADRKLWAEQYEFPPETEVLPPDFPANVASELLQRLRGEAK